MFVFVVKSALSLFFYIFISETDLISLLVLLLLLFFVVLVVATSLKQHKAGSIVSDLIGVKFGSTVLQVNMH